MRKNKIGVTKHVMTPEEFFDKMKELHREHGRMEWCQTSDEEAYTLMMSILRSLGYHEGVNLFEEHNRFKPRYM